MSRIAICGGPRTGKTTLAAAMCRGVGDAFGGADIEVSGPVRHTDDLIERLAHLGKEAWSEGSRQVTEWLDATGPWIIEGVAVSRALRKWRAAHPGEAPPVDKVIRLATPHVALTKGQAAMAKGEETVWQEIADWLFAAGVPLVEQAELRCEHLGYNGTATVGPAGAGSGSRIGWMGLGPGEEP